MLCADSLTGLRLPARRYTACASTSRRSASRSGASAPERSFAVAATLLRYLEEEEEEEEEENNTEETAAIASMEVCPNMHDDRQKGVLCCCDKRGGVG